MLKEVTETKFKNMIKNTSARAETKKGKFISLSFENETENIYQNTVREQWSLISKYVFGVRRQ